MAGAASPFVVAGALSWDSATAAAGAGAGSAAGASDMAM